MTSGQQYKNLHRHEDWSNSLPPISAVKPLINQEQVELWLSKSLGIRLAKNKMMSNPEIRRAFWIVFIGGFRYDPFSTHVSHGLRYGIRAAYDGRMTNLVFRAHVESLDIFTKDFEYPVNKTTGFRGKMKIVIDENEEEEEEQSGDGEDPLKETWEFNWKGVEEILKEA